MNATGMWVYFSDRYAIASAFAVCIVHDACMHEIPATRTCTWAIENFFFFAMIAFFFLLLAMQDRETWRTRETLLSSSAPYSSNARSLAERESKEVKRRPKGKKKQENPRFHHAVSTSRWRCLV